MTTTTPVRFLTLATTDDPTLELRAEAAGIVLQAVETLDPREAADIIAIARQARHDLIALPHREGVDLEDWAQAEDAVTAYDGPHVVYDTRARALALLDQLAVLGIESSDDTLGVVVRQALADDPDVTVAEVAAIWRQATDDASAAANGE
jgi:hypothetical protein